MQYAQIRKEDQAIFHSLMDRYYREGEDSQTPQEEIDFFIGLLFGKLCAEEIRGCFARIGERDIGFALWTVDSADFEFSEMPGSGTILEIGLLPEYRGAGFGRALVTVVEENLCRGGAEECYVTAYGPARRFWERCGYKANGRFAAHALPILIKRI